LFIFFSGVGESYGLVFTGSMAGGRRAVNSNGTYVRFWSRLGTIDELARHRMSSGPGSIWK
jgi:hypothetical protein